MNLPALDLYGHLFSYSFDLLKAMNPDELQESEEGDSRLLRVWREFQKQRRFEGTFHDYAL